MKLRWTLTVFVWLVLLGGLIGLIDEAWENKWLSIAGLAVAGIFFLMMVILYAGCAFTPRLPKRLVVPVSLFFAWVFCGAFPLLLWTKNHTNLVLSILTCAMGLGFLYWLRDEKQFFPLRNPAENRPPFEWKNLLIFGGASLILAPLFFAVCMTGTIAHALTENTGGFLQVRPAGIFTQERTLERNHQRVYLIGMMHAGSKDFYDSVLSDVPKGSKSLVLLEGVDDRRNLLPSGDFDARFRKLNRLLGLTTQLQSSFTEHAEKKLKAPSDSESVHYLQADCDISSLQPQTIAWLRELMAVFSAHPWQKGLLRLENPDSPLRSEKITRIAIKDILQGRNKHLLALIEQSLNTYDNIVVPWGAQHMPWIEQKLKEQGFREIHRADHQIVRF